MKNRLKWRRWINVIDNTIYMPVRIYLPIFNGYIRLLEQNKEIREPFHFHEWVLHNHSNTILLTLRKISDKDKRVYSVRNLLGNIQFNHKSLSLRSYMYDCPTHFKDDCLNYWRSVCGNNEFIPKSVVQQDILEIDILTGKARKAVNQTIAHISKERRYRSFEFESVYKNIKNTLKIFQKYSVLLRCVKTDSIEANIPYDWEEIFKKKWL